MSQNRELLLFVFVVAGPSSNFTVGWVVTGESSRGRSAGGGTAGARTSADMAKKKKKQEGQEIEIR